jgi:SAM-dependent methyltransferase
MDYELVGENIRASYRQISPQYRHDDEIEVTTENHRHFQQILREITDSFDHSISVLDVGCGTGRYFHCVQNTNLLVGVDISADMLKRAEVPVRHSEISARDIRLLCGNVYLMYFPAGSFDFIYSLGMFGHGCPVTPEICARFYDWLSDGGKLFFTVVDMASLGTAYRLRQSFGRIIKPFLPPEIRDRLAERQRQLPFFPMTRRDLRQVMEDSPFSDFAISSHTCQTPLSSGGLLECTALKS